MGSSSFGTRFQYTWLLFGVGEERIILEREGGRGGEREREKFPYHALGTTLSPSQSFELVSRELALEN